MTFTEGPIRFYFVFTSSKFGLLVTLGFIILQAFVSTGNFYWVVSYQFFINIITLYPTTNFCFSCLYYLLEQLNIDHALSI